MTICPTCAAVNRDGAKFCDSCGGALPVALILSATPSPTPASPPFLPSSLPLVISSSPADRFLPPELAAKLQAARSSGAMQGERRVVTMLFCDVKGSTALAEQMDPEEWTEIINAAFERMIRPVYQYEGTVARLMGDGILAFFGAPIAHEDDPVRAVLAALDILDNFRDSSLHNSQFTIHNSQFPPLLPRIGINTGLVVVGAVGSDLRMEYTAMGDAINLAARMEQTAEPGTAQVAEETWRLAAPLFDWQELGKIQLKGKTEPVAAYRPLRRKEAAGRLRGLESHGIRSPLVGRAAESAALAGALQRLNGGEGGLLLLLGEAGLGKSRLLAESREDAQRSTDLAAIRWLEGRTLSFGQGISYWPFQEMLRRFAQIGEDDTEASAWEKLVASLRPLFGDASQEILPYLASLLTIAIPQQFSERVRHLDSEGLGRQIFLASRRFFERLAQAQPLVLVFEDIHWMDESSARLLEHLLPLTARVPLLLVGVSRPDWETPIGPLRALAQEQSASHYTEILLTPLSQSDSTQLIRNLLEIEALPTHARDRIVQQADGNPFFVEEVIRTLISAGLIVRSRETGQWRATGLIDAVQIPNNIQGVIMARVDRLDEDVKEVLRMAAVIGRSFLYRILREVARSGEEIDRRLESLLAVELIRERQSQPELEYVFKHALAQQATYENTLLQRRRELHAQVGEAIESLFADRLDEFSALLAWHFAQAEQWEKAQDYLFKAGDKAVQVAADAEALAHYEKALAVYSRLFGDKWDPIQRARLDRKIGEAYYRRGEHAQAEEHLLGALRLLDAPLPTQEWAVRRAILVEIGRQLLYRLSPKLTVALFPPPAPEIVAEQNRLLEAVNWINIVSHPERFLLSALRSLNLAERANDTRFRVMGYMGMLTVADFFGLYPIGGFYGRLGQTLAEEMDEPVITSYAMQGLTMHASWQGQPQAAVGFGRRSAAAYQQVGNLRGWGAPTMLGGETLVYMGDVAQATSYAEELIRLGEDGGDAQVLAWGYSVLGPAQRMQGRLDAACDSFQRYLELAQAIPDYISVVVALAEWGQTLLLQGKLGEGIAALERSLTVAQEHDVQGGRFLGRVYCGLADGSLRQAEATSAESRKRWLVKAQLACRQARRWAKSYRPWQPEAYRLQGIYEYQRGKVKTARGWWARSITAAEEVGARYELARTYATMGQRLGEAALTQKANTLFDELGVPAVNEIASQGNIE